MSYYKYMTSRKVDEHIESFKKMVIEAQQIGAKFINSHSGCDSWSVDEARQFLKDVINIEQELGIIVTHETHRRRIFWNPFNYRDILVNQPELLQNIKINLDISHWVVCLERCFGSEVSNQENGSDDDAWWYDVKNML